MTLVSSRQQCSAGLGRMWQASVGKFRNLEELRALSQYERQQLADELGLTQSQLEAVVAAGPQASDEVERVMAALGIDASKARAAHADMIRQLRITCATCEAKKICRHALADGTAAALMQSFCPNVGELADLASRKEMRVA